MVSNSNSELIDKINKNYDKEPQMVKNLLVPLFEKMNYYRVYYNHGPQELGKDLVLVEKTALGKLDYIAVVVKKGDVNTEVSREIRNQVEEAFGSEFYDPDAIDRANIITQVYILISGDFKTAGMNNLRAGIFREKKNYIELIDGQRLIEMIKENWPEYFFPEKGFLRIYLEKLIENLKKTGSILLFDTKNENKIFDLWVSPRGVYSNRELGMGTIETIVEPISEIKVDFKSVYENVIEKRGKKIIIVEAEAGMGKSTLLKKFIFDSANIELNLDIFPIFINLRDLEGSKFEVSDYILLEMQKYNLKGDLVKKYLSDGKALVAFDSLDEVLIRDQRNEIISKIKKFFLEFSNIKIIIATRNKDFIKDDAIWSQSNIILNLIAFNDDEIKLFIKNWEKNQLVQEERIIQIFNDKNLKALSARPLILTILMIFFDRNRPIPKRRSLVYEECVNTFLDWDRKKGMNLKFDLIEKRKVLTGLAISAQERKYFTKKEINNRITQVFGFKNSQVEMIFEELIRSELIIPSPPQGFTFIYHFFEYLVAKYLFDNSQLNKIIKNYFDTTKHEIMLLYAGLSEAEENPLFAIIKFPDDLYFQRRLFLAKLENEIAVPEYIQEQIRNLCEEVAKWGFTPYYDLSEFRKYLAMNFSKFQFLSCVTYRNNRPFDISEIDVEFARKIIKKYLMECNNISNIIMFLGRVPRRLLVFNDEFETIKNVGSYFFEQEIYELLKARLTNFKDKLYDFDTNEFIKQIENDKPLDFDNLFSITKKIANNLNINYLLILNFLIHSKKTNYQLKNIHWAFWGLIYSQNSYDSDFWQGFNINLKIKIENVYKLSLYSQKIMISLIKTKFSINDLKLFFEDFIDENTFNAEKILFLTNILNEFRFIKFPRKKKRFEKEAILIVTEIKNGLEKKIKLDKTKFKSILNNLSKNMIYSTTFFPRSIKTWFPDLVNEFNSYFNENIEKLEEEDVFNHSFILSQSKQGRDLIINQLKKIDSTVFSLKRIILLLLMIEDYSNDYPLFMDEVKFSRFLSQDKKNFILNLSEFEKESWLNWLNDINILKI